jgi:hypothetical protein
MAVPVAFEVARMKVKSALRVNRPRCVALPVPSRCLSALVAFSETTCSVDCSVPLNGNAEPPLASVAAAPLIALEGDVGAPGTSLPHAAAHTHKPMTTYRMMTTFRGTGFWQQPGMFVPATNPFFVREGTLCSLPSRQMYAIAHEVRFPPSATGK